jgi:methylmalonyl-CoA mutase cobalamin-binding domain/chain
MHTALATLTPDGLRAFQALRKQATAAVTERFYAEHAATYAHFGPAGRDACSDDLAFHLEFLHPVLEFGILQPMVAYLLWLDSVLEARSIPSEHLALSLDWLAEFFREQMSPDDGAIVAASLEAAKAQFLTALGAPSRPLRAPTAWPETDAFEAALLTGNQRAAVAIMERCLDSGRSLIDFELHVIQPALYGIGEKWQLNRVTVAQEHMATAMVHAVMTLGLVRSPASKPRNKRVLLACVEGNHHAVGLRMVADAFQLDGYEVQYLGPNVPSAAIVQQALDWKPDLIGLSASFAQQLRLVRLVIGNLAERLGDARPAVLVGGLAINRFNQLSGAVGADATCADAGAAVVYARGNVR